MAHCKNSFDNLFGFNASRMARSDIGTENHKAAETSQGRIRSTEVGSAADRPHLLTPAGHFFLIFFF